METVITIDTGTTNFKSMLYSIDGNLLFSSVRHYGPVFHRNQQVRQSPDTWLNALYETLSDTAEYAEQAGLCPSCIIVSSQRASVIPLDKAGNPLYNALMWQDKTTLEQCETLRNCIDTYQAYRKTGLRIDPYFSAPKILWLKDNEPEIFKKTARFAGVQDYVIHLLTGGFVTDHTQASRTLLFDIEKRVWNDDMLYAAGLTRDVLPELIPPGTEAGILLKSISEKTGLPRDIPVLIAGGDQQSAAIGLGIFKSGRAEANTGTGSFIIAHTDKPVFDKDMRILCSISAAPESWVAEAGVLTSGIVYKWLAGELFGNLQPGAKTSANPEAAMEETGIEDINRLALSSETGAGGVIILPHFKGCAAPYWDPYAKGLIFNLTLSSTKADIARAVLESIALELSDNIRIIEENTGKINEITVAGGLTQFELFNSIQADAFGKPVLRYRNPEATSIGALIMAGKCLGSFKTLEEGFKTIVTEKAEEFMPVKSNTQLYSKYSKIRKKLYTSLSENQIYKDIFDINKN